MKMTDLELQNKIYKKKSIGTSSVETPRNVSNDKLSSANTIVTNLLGYILTKHS